MPLIRQYLGQLDHPPSVLEVGIDRGVTLFPLVTAMARMQPQWMYLGVDILVQESVKLTLKNMEDPIPSMTWLLQRNSLDVLPEIVEQGLTFDVVLLDGDHNYHTVSQEMQYVERLVRPGGVIIIDDYDGKWSERDLFYCERPGYEDVGIATSRVETEKHGVKPAVDEWLEAHPGWIKAKPINGEPVLLMQRPT